MGWCNPWRWRAANSHRNLRSRHSSLPVKSRNVFRWRNPKILHFKWHLLQEINSSTKGHPYFTTWTHLAQLLPVRIAGNCRCPELLALNCRPSELTSVAAFHGARSTITMHITPCNEDYLKRRHLYKRPPLWQGLLFKGSAFFRERTLQVCHLKKHFPELGCPHINIVAIWRSIEKKKKQVICVAIT